MSVVSLHVCPRQEVILYQTRVREQECPQFQSCYCVHLMRMRTLASLSSWSVTRTITALCVPPEATYVYALCGGHMLEAVDVVTNKRRIVARLESLVRHKHLVMDCNRKVLCVTDGRVIQVWQRGTYVVLHKYTRRLWAFNNFATFALLDDLHVFIRRPGECTGCASPINDVTFEHHGTAVCSSPPLATRVYVDKNYGLLEIYNGSLRRVNFDGTNWEICPRLITSAAASRTLRQTETVSYACDHVAVFTKCGIFSVIPTHELRCAWMASCCCASQ